MRNNVLAAVDIGTNSFHLIIVEVKENGNFEVIDREKEIIRLGEGSSGDIKVIKPEAIERAVVTLKNFKGIADSYNAELRAVATSAVRESKNKMEFISRVFKETGVEVEVINGYEEARLIYLGLLKAVPVYDKTVLCIDIGGGSTEFIIGREGKILYSQSVKIGSVRMSQKFFPDFKVTSESIEKCEQWIEGEIIQTVHKLKETGFNSVVGTAGSIMAAGLMISEMRDEKISVNTILNNFDFSSKELNKVSDKVLSKKSFNSRKKIPGLDVKRADIIPAGLLILRTAFKMLGLKKMTISGYALREGIIIDSLQKLESESLKPKLSHIRKESVKQLADSFNYDKSHCRHVSNLALKLYDQLEELHGLDRDCREYLEAAAKLHDIGYHIAYTKHHWHSHYIIRNSELLGFNENEIKIIANVARYHRKSHPKARHKEFSQLNEKSKNIVKRLSAILRLADSLDRTHAKNVLDVSAEVMNGVVELDLDYPDSAPEIELWNLDRRKELFEEVFNKKIVVKS